MEKTRKYYKITISTKDPSKYFTRSSNTLDKAIELAIQCIGQNLVVTKIIPGTTITKWNPFTAYNIKRGIRKDGSGKIEGTNGSATILRKTVTKEEFLKIKTHYNFTKSRREDDNKRTK